MSFFVKKKKPSLPGYYACTGIIPYDCWCHGYCWVLTRSPPAPISKSTILRTVEHVGPINLGLPWLSSRRSSWGTENLRSTYIAYSGGSKPHPVWSMSPTPSKGPHRYIFWFASSRFHILWCLSGTKILSRKISCTGVRQSLGVGLRCRLVCPLLRIYHHYDDFVLVVAYSPYYNT